MNRQVKVLWCRTSQGIDVTPRLLRVHVVSLGRGGGDFYLRWIKTSGYETSRSSWEGWLRRIVQKFLSAHIGAQEFLYYVNDSRALIGLCLRVTSRLGQIWGPWHSQSSTTVRKSICLSLHIHYLIHLSFYQSQPKTARLSTMPGTLIKVLQYSIAPLVSLQSAALICKPY